MRSATLRFYSVTTGYLILSATIINRRDAEFAETCNLPYYQHLKRTAYLLLSNSRLRSFVLVRSVTLWFYSRKPPVLIILPKLNRDCTPLTSGTAAVGGLGGNGGRRNAQEFWALGHMPERELLMPEKVSRCSFLISGHAQAFLNRSNIGLHQPELRCIPWRRESICVWSRSFCLISANPANGIP